jgi:hypothetical protein
VAGCCEYDDEASGSGVTELRDQVTQVTRLVQLPSCRLR